MNQLLFAFKFALCLLCLIVFLYLCIYFYVRSRKENLVVPPEEKPTVTEKAVKVSKDRKTYPPITEQQYFEKYGEWPFKIKIEFPENENYGIWKMNGSSELKD